MKKILKNCSHTTAIIEFTWAQHDSSIKSSARFRISGSSVIRCLLLSMEKGSKNKQEINFEKQRWLITFRMYVQMSHRSENK